jgi:hypothetical protein
VAANRRNAQRSTGPTTTQGKARSSQNAVKHGIYAQAHAIGRGPFAEHEDDIAAFVGAIIADLAPRNDLELTWANKIADLSLRVRRLNAFEGALLDGAGRLRALSTDRDGETFLLSDYDLASDISNWLAQELQPLSNTPGPAAGSDPARRSEPESQAPERASKDRVEEDGVAYEDFSRFLRRMQTRKVKVRGIWDDEHTPTTASEWHRVFRVLVKHYFEDDLGAMEEWLMSIRRDLIRRLSSVQGVEAERAANRSLAVFGQTVAIAARLNRELERTFDTYSLLQQRPIPKENRD